MPLVLTDNFVTAYLLLAFCVGAGSLIVILELAYARIRLGSWRAACASFK